MVVNDRKGWLSDPMAPGTRISAITIGSLIRLVILLAGVSCGCNRATAAMTADCLAPSLYSTLARVSDGDIGRLMLLIGRSESERPPSGACRAILLSGTVEQGSTRALLSAVDANRGWLTTVYLALNDGDIAEELMMAAVIRGFALETFILQREGFYNLDFVLLSPILPTSVSNGWPDPLAQPLSPLTLSVRDYTSNVDLKLPVGNVRCDYACWTLLSAGVERRTNGVAQAPTSNNGAATGPDAETRRSARQSFGMMQTLHMTDTGVVLDAPFLIQPPEILNATMETCRNEIDYANGLRTAYQVTVDKIAEKDFPLLPLAQLSQQMKRIHDAGRGIKRCTVAALERARRKAYEEQCGSACNIDALMVALQAMMKGGDESKASSPKR